MTSWFTPCGPLQRKKSQPATFAAAALATGSAHRKLQVSREASLPGNKPAATSGSCADGPGEAH
jgi:hypothetical protein